VTIAPILDSITIVRFAILAALDPLTTSGVYWLEAPETAVRPFVVVQSQDAGGRSEPRLSSLGWSGLITVKALAHTLQAAEALLGAVAPGMATLNAPTGYDMTAEHVRPIVLGPRDGVWQAGHIWLVSLERE
jgi:hypothetical protein